ncbi:MAG: DJ-1/PfpI family protein [Clostridiales bacterium]|nr:DJ-1/PfpI family protein [Clostridiales bacterium]MDD7432131.1 DJ-1/PfpI family protein [Clostridiales bacterium]MDY3061116.1 DJ-1/PfpI family protein [Eubacteriales bacterium]
MKKTAVFLYDTCCLFELTVALEMLSMANKEVVYFGKSLEPIRSEEGILIKPEHFIQDLNIDDFDSLLLTGASDAKGAVEDPEVLEFIAKFVEAKRLIGAISIAPMFLLKLGVLKRKPFMMGVEKIHLYEEGFSEEDLEHMVSWKDACEGKVPEKFLKAENIITSVAFGFRQWAMAIGKELGLPLYPKSFDL